MNARKLGMDISNCLDRGHKNSIFGCALRDPNSFPRPVRARA
jgi:hypothetical protein